MKVRKFSSPGNEKEFYKTLRQRVYLHLKGQHTHHGSAGFWLKGAFWALVCYGAYYMLLTTQSAMSFWAYYFVFQIAGLLVGFSLGHDASHNTAFKNKRANQVLHFFSFITVGIDPLLWGLRHIRSHHLYANVEGSDIDIDKNPFLRLAPSHPWAGKHRFQHIYAPFVYMLALLHSVFMGDWVYLFSKEYHWMKKGVPGLQLCIRFFAFKILYFVITLLLPLILTDFSFGFIFLAYIGVSAFTSLIFVVMLVGTHFFDEAEYYEPEGNHLESSWAVHQLKTSCDWNPDSALARLISGGSNCHAAHHLFPNMCHTHYGTVNSIIEEVTSQYGLPYHKTSLPAMMRSHYKHLRRMGRKDL